MEGALYSAAVTIVIGMVAWIAGRFSIKSKVQVKVDKQDERLCEIENTQPLIVEGVFILLQSAKKKGEINGESDGLMKRFEDHLFDRKK